MLVKHIQDVEASVVKNGNGISKKVLISLEEAPNFAMRCFIIQPGGSMPNHTDLVEHEQYVISGHAKIGIDGKIYEVHEGDIVYIPAEIPHWYKNIGQEPFEFLCLVPNKKNSTTILV